MAKARHPKDSDPAGHDAPWRQRTPVKGVVPPGRKLSTEPRARIWHASGVQGITPPGSSESAPTNTPPKPTTRRARAEGKPKGTAQSKSGAKPSSPLPLQGLLDRLAEHVRENVRATDEVLRDLSREMLQTHAPFEIVVGFTLLSALVGTDEARRRELHLTLERGAKAFYNLARRLDPKVRAPRGLVPQTLDPLFYDVPDMAYQLPEPFVLHAFAGYLELLKSDPEHDRRLMSFMRELRQELIEGRRFGEQPLERMFPWREPDWAPELD